MSSAPRVKYRLPELGVSVEPYGAVATILLENRLKLRPKGIALLHAVTSSTERGLGPGGKEAVAVWARVVWADKSETLGFVCRPDAELIWAAFPKKTLWFSRCLGGQPVSRLRKIMP